MSAHFASDTLAITDHFRVDIVVGSNHYTVRNGDYSYRARYAPIAYFQSEAAAIAAGSRLAGRLARLTGEAHYTVILRAVYNDAGIDCGSSVIHYTV